VIVRHVVRYAVGCVATALWSIEAAAAVPTLAPHEQLTAIAQEFIAASATLDPMVATDYGIPGHDGDLAIPSEATRREEIARLRGWKRRVAAIAQMPAVRASLVDSDDAKLLQAHFDAFLDRLVVREADRKSYARPALRLTEAIFTQFLHLPVVGREGATQADVDRAWGDIASRLSKGPAYLVAAQRLITKPGKLAGIVGARQLAGSAEFFKGALSDAAEMQLAHDPAALQRFFTACDAAVKTITDTKSYLDTHAGRWPENYVIGKAAYNRMLRDEQLLPFDADDLERMGRDELAHGWAEEAWLMSLAKRQQVAFGAASGGGMAPDGAALVGYYRDRLAELREFVDTHDVVTVPDWLGSMEIVETPPFLQPVSPGASMNPPRLFSTSTTGYYFITPPKSLEEAAQRLDMNEDFDRDRIWSTGAHEAYPGHFFQLSIAHRHPDFIRKITDSSAFAEGWAFYGEEMFVRLGLYGDDLDARLFTARWERVRGARAVVDVKLATGEWTVAQAATFFEAQSGFTKEASEAAVSGIALGPGYVIAYTVGRFQLETLLAEYLAKTGERSSLHDFHDRLLSYGTVPFAICGPELIKDLDKPASAVRAAANY
jgi:uncharacterized protein (DUF885 family)